MKDVIYDPFAAEIIDEDNPNVKDGVLVEESEVVDGNIPEQTEDPSLEKTDSSIEATSDIEQDIDNNDNVDLSDEDLQKQIDQDLSEIENLIKEMSVLDEPNESNDSKNNEENQEALERSVKIIEKLQKQNSKLQIEKAEAMRLGTETVLDPSVIIFKANLSKAKDGDKDSLYKIKQLIKNEFGFEIQEPKDFIFSDSIKSSVSYEDPVEKNKMFGDFM